MDKQLTLGSLFDGSGGFALGGLICGITPLWASEVEPFPIRVTTKRLPETKHYGDINKINGAAVSPADIITAGFCCQDLSVAGKRAGLHGKRSGLFFQVIRIIKEMRTATNNEYPKFAVLENVPGMYSSNKGLDFLEVLNELIRVKDEALSVPLPEKGKWSTSGEIVGDGFSIGWRTLDAQFWGVAQRRRRCYIVVDFTGERAGEILFDESRLRGNPPQGGFARKATAGGFTDCTRAAVAFEPGACSRLGGHVWDGEPVGALRADMGDNQTSVVYDARGNGNGETVNTITGDHENRVTDYTALCITPDSTPVLTTAYGICSQASNSMKSANPNSGIYEAETSRTLDINAGRPDCNQGGIAVVSVQGSMVGRAEKNGPQGSGVGEDISFTLTEADRHAVCYQNQVGSLCASDYKFPQQQQAEEGKAIVEQVNPGSRYAVRRLTPTECALLQGFPPDWCAGLGTPEPTEEDIAFWSEVWETQRNIMGTSTKPKSRTQIVKWLQSPHSDSAEYKMWGNGVALPCVVYVLGGIAACFKDYHPRQV